MIKLSTQTKVLALLRDLKERGSIKPEEEIELAKKIKETPSCPDIVFNQKKLPALN